MASSGEHLRGVSFAPSAEKGLDVNLTDISLAAAMAAGLAAPAFADPPQAPPAGPFEAVADGRPILDIRTRFEDVNQSNLIEPAQSLTSRTQLGWQTASWNGFHALVEFAGSFHADAGHYNVAVPGGASLNGRTQFPIVNDPSFATLNRAQLAWTPSPHFTITVGRQRILIDDQRFVGNSGWRQDEQRFDAARADLRFGKLNATYVYAWRVDRIYGGELDWNSDSHLFNAAYDVAPPLRLEGFVYALDFSNASPTQLANAAANSSLTYGVRASGKLKAGALALAYDGTWARQESYLNQPARFSLDFWQADLAGTYGVATVRADFEQLNGDGVQGFTTPIATTHAFQGWADAFAADAGNKTSPDGIRDLNLAVVLRPDWKTPFASHPEATIRFFDFHAELTGAYLASEWDAQVQAALTHRLTAALKYADFQRATSVPAGTIAAPPSRTKVWVTLEYKL
jgi:hypothetical protein